MNPSQKEYTKTVFAAILGTFIGGMVAFNIYSSLWWVGMIVGALTGYLSFGWREVYSVACQTWKEMASMNVGETVIQKSKRSWRSITVTFKWWVYYFFGWGTSLSVGICLFLQIMYTTTVESAMYSQFTIFSYLVCVVTLACAFAIFMDVAQDFGTLRFYKGKAELQSFRWKVRKNRSSIRKYNIFRIYLYVVPLAIVKGGLTALKGILWCMKRAPWACGFAAAYIYRVFVFTHSDGRLIAGAGGAFGTGIWYLSGNIAIGVIASVLIVLVNKYMLPRMITLARSK